VIVEHDLMVREVEGADEGGELVSVELVNDAASVQEKLDAQQSSLGVHACDEVCSKVDAGLESFSGVVVFDADD